MKTARSHPDLFARSVASLIRETLYSKSPIMGLVWQIAIFMRLPRAGHNALLVREYRRFAIPELTAVNKGSINSMFGTYQGVFGYAVTSRKVGGNFGRPQPKKDPFANPGRLS